MIKILLTFYITIFSAITFVKQGIFPAICVAVFLLIPAVLGYFEGFNIAEWYFENEDEDFY